MKIQITIDDYAELTDKQKQAYRNYCKLKEYGEYINSNENSFRAERFTLGQMLEFLFDHKQPMTLLEPWEIIKAYGTKSCDRLWENCKRVLDTI